MRRLDRGALGVEGRGWRGRISPAAASDAALRGLIATTTEAQKNSLFQMIPMIPMGRLGTPQEYASLAVYLASDEHYLAGQVISPNGGMVM